ncbi:hypothetical protein L3056_11120, partial [Corynebacterium sp. MC-25]|nr:hypothetical protein [Corynebacterium parakroppenstedtii]
MGPRLGGLDAEGSWGKRDAMEGRGVVKESKSLAHGHGDDVVSAQQILASEARLEHSKRKRPY